MDSQEAIESIPNIKICLDDLKVFTDPCDQVPKKVNIMKVKLDNLKLKSHFQALQSLQQSPKISKISQLLTSPSSTKSSYVSNLKSTSKSNKHLPKTSKKIDYSRCNSLSQFAISNSKLPKSPEPEVLPEAEADNKDMYTKGQAYIKKKQEKLEKEMKMIDEETKKICTFVPDTKAGVNGKKRGSKGKTADLSKYKPLSPFNSEFRYRAGCDLDSLKDKCTVMESYLTVKMPNS